MHHVTNFKGKINGVIAEKGSLIQEYCANIIT